ncbi:MAG: aminoacetone oxidase family FAD-binding enzyme [Ruminococcus sp.]|nr:aminoacetone oxidase family FAD-binding enzyme [Ruminococcus sp.]
MKYDIAIIGGGASGLTAAISAKMTNPQKSVIVIEKLARVGKKIIATGNGKCNLSNMNISAYNYHGSVNAMEIIQKMPDYKEFFTDTLGVLCINGSEGREGGIYPRSNNATTVLNALRLKMQELGVIEMCNCEITDIVPGILLKDGFKLKHKDSEISCQRLIIASGGYSAPSFGTDGKIIRLLKNMGYITSKICPAVAPLKVNPNKLKGLKGVRVKGEVSAVSDGKILRTEKGELQFNDNNISGICVFNLAYLFQKYEGKLSLVIDLMPDIPLTNLEEYIYSIRKSRAEYTLEDFLTGAFTKNLALYITKNAVNRPLTDKISSLTANYISAICKKIKALEFEVEGCSPWQNAQATMGGITASQVDKNLRAKKHKGMYFCGEVLDVVGDCGGYNLQWAWSSGILVGRKAASDDKD